MSYGSSLYMVSSEFLYFSLQCTGLFLSQWTGMRGSVLLDKLFCSLLLWCLIIVKLQVVYSFESSLRFCWVGKG